MSESNIFPGKSEEELRVLHETARKRIASIMPDDAQLPAGELVVSKDEVAEKEYWFVVRQWLTPLLASLEIAIDTDFLFTPDEKKKASLKLSEITDILRVLPDQLANNQDLRIALMSWINRYR